MADRLKMKGFRNKLYRLGRDIRWFIGGIQDRFSKPPIVVRNPPYEDLPPEERLLYAIFGLECDRCHHKIDSPEKTRQEISKWSHVISRGRGKADLCPECVEQLPESS